MIQIVALIACSLGNGTRAAGFVFGTVKLKGENKLYQLLQEIRKSGSDIGKLKTAEVELSEGVSKREFSMALNNPQLITSEEPKQVFNLKDLLEMNVDETVEAIKKLPIEQQKEAVQFESENKNRKSVMEEFDFEEETPAVDWKQTQLESLPISDDAKIALAAAELSTVADFQNHVDANEGVVIEGLTEEMTGNLMAAIKELIKE